MPRKPWILHDHDASAALMMEMLTNERGFAAGYRYWKLIELLRGLSGCRLQVEDAAPRLAGKWTGPRDPCTPEQAQELLDVLVNRYRLIKSDGEYIWSERLLRDVTDYESICQAKSRGGRRSADARKLRFGSAQPPKTLRENLEVSSDSHESANITQPSKSPPKTLRENPEDTSDPSKSLRESVRESPNPSFLQEEEEFKDSSSSSGVRENCGGGASDGAPHNLPREVLTPTSKRLEILEKQAQAGNRFAARAATKLRAEQQPDDWDEEGG